MEYGVTDPNLKRILDLERAIRVAKRLLGPKTPQGTYVQGQAGEDLDVGFLLEKEFGRFVRWKGNGNPAAISLAKIDKGNYGFFQISNLPGNLTQEG